MTTAAIDTPETLTAEIKALAPETPSVEVTGEELDKEAIQEMRRYMMEPSVTRDRLGKPIQRWRDRRQEIRAKLDRKIDRGQSGIGTREIARRLRQMEKINGKKLQGDQAPIQ